jgi:hypothetical protein
MQETVTGKKHPDGIRDSFETKLIKVNVKKRRKKLLEPM